MCAADQSPLLTDLQRLDALKACFDSDRKGNAVFELYVRKLPPGLAFLIAAGLEQALAALETLRYDPEEIECLAGCGRLSPAFVDYIASLRFTGEVQAMPEGTICFPDEPLLRVVAPLPEAQLVETRLVNLLRFQTMIASKAARVRLAGGDRKLVDFSRCGAHVAGAGLLWTHATTLLIDHFGVGRTADCVGDGAWLDCAYALQEYAGVARRDWSEGRSTWPGRKQVFRRYDHDGWMTGDTLTLEAATATGKPLLATVMRNGRRLAPPKPLAEIRAHALRQLASLPDDLRRLDACATYPVEVAAPLRALAREVDARLALEAAMSSHKAESQVRGGLRLDLATA
jgi:nicotinic acid phosphoribosyltransferase